MAPARATAELKFRFPAYRDLNGSDFTSSEITEALVRQLQRCEFLDGAHNVVLVGSPVTGKPHRCHILESGNDRFRFKNSSAITTNPTKEKTRNLIAT